MKEALLRGLRQIVPRRWHRSARLETKLAAALDLRVTAGPFAGLAYVEESYGSAYWPKLLGTYELEIQQPLERLLARPILRVLVAGAAEGYYAVGLARRLPEARVVAWEANDEARQAMIRLARLNGVEARLDVRAICDFGELAAALAGAAPTLVVFDLDGGEAALLDPEVVPALRTASILAEVHDCFVPGLTERLRRRFAASHELEQVPARPRQLADVADLGLPTKFDGALLQLLSERRPPGNDWLVMTPKKATTRIEP